MPHIERPGQGRWRAWYRGPDSRERSRTFDRKADAERWLAGVTVSTARGEWIDPSLGRVTFAEWCERWAPTIVDLRPATMARDLDMVRNHLIPAFGPVPLAKLTTVDVAAWIAGQTAAGRHSPATVRKATDPGEDHAGRRGQRADYPVPVHERVLPATLDEHERDTLDGDVSDRSLPSGPASASTFGS